MCKYLIPGFILVFFLSCATDPMVSHYNNWMEVTRTLSSHKEHFKSCRGKFQNKLKDNKYIIYTFNIVGTSAQDFATFSDPYKLPDEFHNCVKESLSKISFTLKEIKEFRNGYLLIDKKQEKFNHILY